MVKITVKYSRTFQQGDAIISFLLTIHLFHMEVQKGTHDQTETVVLFIYIRMQD